MNDELLGIDYLRQKLKAKKRRVDLRYKYYDMKYQVKDMNISTPIPLRQFNSVLGWCSKTVDTLADRLVFRGFKNDDYEMEEIFDMNNPDIFFDSAILSALISSCCFVYISKDLNDEVRLQVIDGANATGVIDPITNLLKEGYAILDYDEDGNVSVEAYFTRNHTEILKNGKTDLIIKNPTNIPLLVPIVYRPDAVRPFGHSRISRACINLIQEACRTIKRSEISAEFYSFPQKYVLGTSQESDPLNKWSATMSSFIEISKDDDGEKPTIGQFSQQSMAPYNDQMKMIASLFAGETGLTVDDLGFVSDNPSSAEAIKASHENLRLLARKAQRTFGTCFLNVGYVGACLRDETPYSRALLRNTKPCWEPIFEPDSSMLSSIGDGVIKVNQAIPGYFDKETLRELIGIESNLSDLDVELASLEIEGKT